MFGELMCRLPNTLRNVYYESLRASERGVWSKEEEERLKTAVTYVNRTVMWVLVGCARGRCDKWCSGLDARRVLQDAVHARQHDCSAVAENL